MSDPAPPPPVGPRIASLCSGYGGLDLAVTSLLGGTPVWFAETDPDARNVLAARWPDTPLFGDITAIDWTAVPAADVITSGHPCQPFATQGQQKGADDDRDVWPCVLDAINTLRPQLAVFENVPGWRNNPDGLPRTLRDLAAIGYDTAWCTHSASDVGAPHRRARVFAAARPSETPPDPPGLPERDARPQTHPQPGDRRDGRTRRPPWLEHRRRTLRGVGEPPRTGTVPDSPPPGCEKPFDWQEYGPAVQRWTDCRMVAPPCPIAPVGVDGREEVAPAFLEWMMAVPVGWVSSVPMDYRSAYRLLGNGVCPPAGAAALHHLLGQLDAPAQADTMDN
ncbi:DNA cytosine methyltransferase [Streptomyces sp. NPDC090085]|uniref:DNA cytosine methyltransferase n=1 Tax=Streptomyces sp. NPDC090085 TaxID=3365943 RepID=UPI0037F54FC8